MLSALALAAAAAPPPALAAKPHRLVGKPTRYAVRPGDTLYAIARRHDVAVPAIVRLNMLASERVKPGQRLLLPTWQILPAEPPEGIVLNIPECRVYVFREGKLAAVHPVTVGRPTWQTAMGTYRVVAMRKNPTWHPPKSLVEKEGVKDTPVPPGPDNPLGDRFIAWSAPGYGFHSTNAPRSVGHVASHGCVRLYPEQARALFDQAYVGLPIFSLYEPVKVGKENGSYYLSVSPDVYGRGEVTVASVNKKLEEMGLLGLADPVQIGRIVAERRSYPERIVGSSETIQVDGAEVPTSVPPTRVGDYWVVPARAVAQALGGSLEPDGTGGYRVTLGARTLALTPGRTDATIGGITVTLPVAPALLDGTLMVPLHPLLDMTGCTMRREPGKALLISHATTQP